MGVAEETAEEVVCGQLQVAKSYEGASVVLKHEAWFGESELQREICDLGADFLEDVIDGVGIPPRSIGDGESSELWRHLVEQWHICRMQAACKLDLAE